MPLQNWFSSRLLKHLPQIAQLYNTNCNRLTIFNLFLFLYWISNFSFSNYRSIRLKLSNKFWPVLIWRRVGTVTYTGFIEVLLR